MSVLSTLFVGIDVSKLTNQIRAIDFNQNEFCNISIANNEIGANAIKECIVSIMAKNDFKSIIFVIESTGVYSYHIATFLSSNSSLSAFNSLVYCVNPKAVKKYRESYNDSDKTDPKDALALADYARVGRCKSLAPWRGSQLLALQRLTRYRISQNKLLEKKIMF